MKLTAKIAAFLFLHRPYCGDPWPGASGWNIEGHWVKCATCRYIVAL